MNVKHKRITEKIVNITLDILIFIFGIILLISIYNNIQINILGNDYSSFFGRSIFEVQTGSMAGTIEAGDWIIVKYSDDIELDDIVTYKQDKEFVTHRVIEAYKGTYVTKGDANNAKDKPISKEQIVGKVVKVLPNFGLLKKTIFNPAILVAIIITLYCINLVFKNNKKEVGESKAMENVMKVIIEFINKSVDKIKELIASKVKTKEVSVDDRVDIASISIGSTKVDEPVTIKEEKIEEVKEDFDVVKQEEVVVTKVSDSNFESTTDIPTESELVNEDDLDKTMFYRMVSVDRDELDTSYVEAVDNQIKEEVKKADFEIEPDKEVSESEITEHLERLQRKRKKFNNIIEKIMYIKNEEILEMIDVLNNHEKNKVNEASIRDNLLKVYIDAKYYNYCGDVNVEYNGRNMATRIATALSNAANDMATKYKGSDNKYIEKVQKYADIFTLIMYLEQAYVTVEDKEILKKTYNTKILKHLDAKSMSAKALRDMITGVIRVQRTHRAMIRYVLNKLETNMFILNYNQTTNKNIYAVALEHNLNFSKVYSDYIVNKTYTEGIVAEDKMAVLINLLLISIVKDMLNGDFKKKYAIYIPGSLYEKQNKLDKIFDLISDEYVKNSVYVVLQYKELTKNRKVIKKFIKEGHNFVVDLGETTEIKARDEKLLYLMSYMFVERKVAKKTGVLETVPKDIQSNIIYDDIRTKVGNYGG